jgi:hypothetical protein
MSDKVDAPVGFEVTGSAMTPPTTATPDVVSGDHGEALVVSYSLY